MNQHHFPESTAKTLYGYYNDSMHAHSPVNDNKTPRKIVLIRSLLISSVIGILGWLLFK